MGEKKVIEEKEEAMKSKTSLVFAVNGERFELDLSSIDPSTTLIDFLRTKLLSRASSSAVAKVRVISLSSFPFNYCFVITRNSSTREKRTNKTEGNLIKSAVYVGRTEPEI